MALEPGSTKASRHQSPGCQDERGCYLAVVRNLPICTGQCGLWQGRMRGTLERTIAICRNQGLPLRLGEASDG